MKEKSKYYEVGYEGFNQRLQENKQSLHDLIRWLEYGKTTGYIASRQSKEQEEYWADQLKKLLKSQEATI